MVFKVLSSITKTNILSIYIDNNNNVTSTVDTQKYLEHLYSLNNENIKYNYVLAIEYINKILRINEWAKSYKDNYGYYDNYNLMVIDWVKNYVKLFVDSIDKLFFDISNNKVIYGQDNTNL